MNKTLKKALAELNGAVQSMIEADAASDAAIQAMRTASFLRNRSDSVPDDLAIDAIAQFKNAPDFKKIAAYPYLSESTRAALA